MLRELLKAPSLGLLFWKIDLNTEEQERYNWLDPQEPPHKKDQHFGLAVGRRPVQIFHDGPYDTLEEGCYRRAPATGSDDL